ncbi:hypothetical protein SHJG_p1081 (plasmid) [Streptomyces hygroscopicus subsp. jinggangensis 5008]|nr:hypothetical protein SHJG_p1081 [Streptomyces hygroscopicus subsp. jinggangensis 5008]AGF68366.1 hypothetical protein SHJGH_p1081 [Streptomyces hygroscopicus subsp. jinggangensis TL01]
MGFLSVSGPDCPAPRHRPTRPTGKTGGLVRADQAAVRPRPQGDGAGR